MEELQMLVTMVAGLPTLTIWVLAGYLLYRLVIVGSIYGVIRLAIERYHSYKTTPPPAKVVEHKVAGCCINEDVLQALQVQVIRLATAGGYIHSSSVTKLRDAINLIEQGEVK